MTKKRKAVTILAAGAAIAAYAYGIHPALLRFGASDDELRGPWPGDDLSPGGIPRSTCAITIDAPAHQVWPWIVQLGQDRAGFYSYRRLENAIGCTMPDVRVIDPAFQHRARGDAVWLGPHARFGDLVRMTVARYEPDSAMILVMAGDGARLERGESMRGGTWGFIVYEPQPNQTRLLTRSVAFSRPSFAARVLRALVFDSTHAVMERKMTRTIKQLAEARA